MAESAPKLSPGPNATPESKHTSETLPQSVSLGQMASHPRMDRSTGFSGTPVPVPGPLPVEQMHPLKGR